MTTSLLPLLATTASTSEWNLSIGIVMIVCNLVAIALGRFAIKNPGQGPDLPISKPALWEGFGLTELLATGSFGHILGAGVILGLTNAGVL
ncbi:photosystem I reaction center subunit PsaK [Spirulina subsalsa]|uniref:photosystem I reaction center subunit PsaK n=1 Tax=Spirulina subsalsa TaxID=54311 RepID=UPI0002F048DB